MAAPMAAPTPAPMAAPTAALTAAALATGKVDFVLPPAEIAAELVHLAARRPLNSIVPRRAGDGLTLLPEHFQRMFELLHSHSGDDFAQYKLPTVQRRIQRRMTLHRVHSVEQY